MDNQSQQLRILKTELHVGLPAPVKLLHVTDTHIAYDDPGHDCGRMKHFDGDVAGRTANYFEQAVRYAKQQNIPMLHTGDLIDFLSDATFTYVDRMLEGLDYIYAAGNHDFCHCVGEAKEDAAYKWEHMKITAPHFKSNLLFDSRVINGLNIVTLDNSYYLISDGQTDMLRAEAAKGYPILLCMHTPLYTPGYAEMRKDSGEEGLCLVSAPQHILDGYNAHRRQQQTPDAATLRAVEYIKSEPLIKALIVGHLHENFEDTLENGVPQITTHGTFAGYVRELTIV